MTPSHLLPSAYRDQTAVFGNIERVIAEAFSMKPEDLHRPTRQLRINWPRQVAMWAMREATGETWCNVAAHFSMDHVNAIHAHRRVKEIMQCYPNVKEEIEALKVKCKAVVEGVQ